MEIEYNENSEPEDLGDEYLGFALEGETYCVDILSVKEIRGWSEPTVLPNAPSYVKGIINIRGDIVPIVDIRERYQLSESTYSKTTVIIILSVTSGNKSRVMGIVVDAVSDVLNIKQEKIKEAPKNGNRLNDENVLGLYNHNNKVYILLNVESLLDLSEIKQYYSRQFDLEAVGE
ncbi:MAG: purine-binding chemotaxis protein CheW [Gammaproteobacteria bacterium]|nr:purine-binding chemotaxis protein CheW [Gammaproteobacteria bacterium]